MICTGRSYILALLLKRAVFCPQYMYVQNMLTANSKVIGLRMSPIITSIHVATTLITTDHTWPEIIKQSKYNNYLRQFTYHLFSSISLVECLFSEEVSKF